MKSCSKLDTILYLQEIEVPLKDLCHLVTAAFAGIDGRNISYSNDEKEALLELHQAISESLPVDEGD